MSLYRNKSGVDLDSVFLTRVSSPTSNTGFRNADGQDLAQRYEPYNGINVAAETGFRGPNGSDLNLWFATTASLAANAFGSEASFNLGNASSPVTRVMSTGANVVASGGTGTYTYVWTVTGSSNVSSVSISGSTANNCTVTATATLNTLGTVNLNCAVTSGGNTVNATTQVTFNYFNTV